MKTTSDQFKMMTIPHHQISLVQKKFLPKTPLLPLSPARAQNSHHRREAFCRH